MASFEFSFYFSVSVVVTGLYGSSVTQGNPCSGLYWGQSVEIPDSCYSYDLCIFTIPTKRECPENTVFDIIEKKCLPGDPETCEIFGLSTEVPLTLPLPEFTTAPAKIHIPSAYDELEDLYEETNSPSNTKSKTSEVQSHKTSFSSVASTQAPKTVPPGTSVLPVQVIQKEVFKTVSQQPSPSKSLNTNTSITDHKSVAEICRGVFFGARPYPGTETSYVGCTRDKNVIIECFDGEVFKRSVNECVIKD